MPQIFTSQMGSFGKIAFRYQIPEVSDPKNHSAGTTLLGPIFSLVNLEKKLSILLGSLYHTIEMTAPVFFDFL